MASPPVILVMASTYPRWAGDPEPAFVHELNRRLSQWFDVITLAPHAPGALRFETLDGVRVHRFAYAPASLETLVNDGGIAANLRRSPWKLMLLPGFLLAQWWEARRLIRRYRPSVVHAHWLIPQGIIAAHLCRRGPALVATSHGGDVFALRSSWFARLRRSVARQARAVSVVSTALRDRLVAEGVNAESLMVQPMGVDLCGRFVLAPEVRRTPYELLFVGRLVEKKGLQQLLAALPQVLRRYPKVKLKVIGFGPWLMRLRRQAAVLGIESYVEFLGPRNQSDLPLVYRRASLLVAPFVRARSGDRDGMPVTVIEALGCGCPVVAGDLPALREIFGDQANRFLVDPLDTDALARAILSVLDDPSAAEAATLRLRKRLVHGLDWQTVAQNYAQLLAQAAGLPLPNPSAAVDRIG